MAIRVGPHTFPYVTYDGPSDVLYARQDRSGSVARRSTPEGDYLTFDADGRFNGITVMEPRERLERDGAVYVTTPAGALERVQGIEAALR